MTTLTKDLKKNARILAVYVKEIASAKSESRGRQRKLTVGHDPRSVATRPQSIANMSHAKKGIISTNETDRAVSVGGRRENQLVRVLLGRWMFCRCTTGRGIAYRYGASASSYSSRIIALDSIGSPSESSLECSGTSTAISAMARLPAPTHKTYQQAVETAILAIP
ncbi:uncharacterized protein CCOS01_11149 [Colletotrichum costaricense]|uniref:Uncharacterized protein n=2 Tax=Colletotrichum acutatum species complex TaxID=2707335 RepID=A0AAI9YQY6_9PEZI|nr:uncharacterized protein CCOS01_11149 [Colletotrichum costaricense]XP_060381298.1 uncharacterized protein CTAM01_08111 [Colletotrichum tamarilloi]KAK1497099.1 hypothetical protein CTAM01_08111 [Colletotrichum tamarilloi]KAK1519498.1 hypothetical protein CCOS01_11149 [Colletotrichum costaricense]